MWERPRNRRLRPTLILIFLKAEASFSPLIASHLYPIVNLLYKELDYKLALEVVLSD